MDPSVPVYDSAATDPVGTYALIIGASEYPYLKDGANSAPGLPTYGLGQLATSALTAYRFFEWIQEVYEYSAAPLSKCWLLLSPTPAELAVEPRLGGYDPATMDNCVKAVEAWYDALQTLTAPQGRACRTIFFFSGHGIERVEGRLVLLPSDYLRPPLRSINDAIDTTNLRKGLGMLPRGEDFFFVDACRGNPPEMSTLDLEPRPILNTLNTNPPNLDRVAPILFATPSGSTAWQPGSPAQGISCYGQALIEGLSRSVSPTWPTCVHSSKHIRLDTLFDYMKPRLSALLGKLGFVVNRPIDIIPYSGEPCITEPLAATPEPLPAIPPAPQSPEPPDGPPPPAVGPAPEGDEPTVVEETPWAAAGEGATAPIEVWEVGAMAAATAGDAEEWTPELVPAAPAFEAIEEAIAASASAPEEILSSSEIDTRAEIEWLTEERHAERLAVRLEAATRLHRLLRSDAGPEQESRGLETAGVAVPLPALHSAETSGEIRPQTSSWGDLYAVFASERVSEAWHVARSYRLERSAIPGAAFVLHRVRRAQLDGSDSQQFFEIELAFEEAGTHWIELRIPEREKLPAFGLVFPGNPEGELPRFHVEMTRDPEREYAVEVSLSSYNHGPLGRAAALWNRYQDLDRKAVLTEIDAQASFDVLQKKTESPLAALVAASLLVRSGRGGTRADWLHNLATWFPELPDAVVFDAEVTRQEWAKDETMEVDSPPDWGRALLAIEDRNLPCSSYGVQLAAQQVSVMLAYAKRYPGWPSSDAAPRLERYHERLRSALTQLHGRGLFAVYAGHQVSAELVLPREA